MYKIRLINEFLHEPIWIYDQNKKIRLKYALISNDPVLQSLNEEVATLYDSFYKFDIDNEPCKFDNDEYRAAFPKIMQCNKSSIKFCTCNSKKMKNLKLLSTIK